MKKEHKEKIVERIYYWESKEGDYLATFYYNYGFGETKKITMTELEELKKKYGYKVQQADEEEGI